MGEVEATTLHLIHLAAMQEFLEKDFKSASLRNIVKKAGASMVPAFLRIILLGNTDIFG